MSSSGSGTTSDEFESSTSRGGSTQRDDAHHSQRQLAATAAGVPLSRSSMSTSTGSPRAADSSAVHHDGQHDTSATSPLSLASANRQVACVSQQRDHHPTTLAEELYTHHCAALGIAPAPAVDIAFRGALFTGCLALRGISLGARGLTALCKALVEACEAFDRAMGQGSDIAAAGSLSASPSRRGVGGGASASNPTKASPLRSVIVSNCYLGDAGCAEICAALSQLYATSAAISAV
jgi:hypothetical protein